MTTRHLINALWALAAAVPLTFAGHAAAQGGGGQDITYDQLRIGQRVDGELSNDDMGLPDGTRMDIYLVELTGGENYSFAIQANGIETGVALFTEEGNQIEGVLFEYTQQGLTVQVPQSGTYSLAVMGNGTGRYTLTSQAGVAAPNAQGGPGQGGEGQGNEGGPQNVQQIQGELNREDLVTDDGRFYAYMAMELQRGETYYFAIVAQGFSPQFDMQDEAGNQITPILTDGDDSTAVIAITAPASGTYNLFIVSQTAGESGAYTFTAWQDDPPPQDTPQNNGPRNDGPRNDGPHNDGPRPNNPERNNPEPAVGTIDIADQLANGDTALEDGSYFDYHLVELVAGVTYTIDVIADRFDAQAYLFDAENNQLDMNDDGPRMGTNSRITFTPETTGEYSVGVSSVGAGQTGGYRVLIAPAREENDGPTPNVGPRPNPNDDTDGPGPGPVAGNDDTPNAIFHADGSADAQNNAVTDVFHLEAGQTIVIETYGLSDGCDTVLYLHQSQNGRVGQDDALVAENDDDEGLLSSRIVFTATEAGDYYAVVGAYEGSAGSFSLIVRDPYPARESIVAPGLEIEQDSYVVAGNFTLEAGSQYVVIETLDLTEDCDTVIELRRVVDPNNRNDDDPLIAADDDYFTNQLLSRIYFQCEEAGEYYVVIRNIGKGDGTCTFRLRFEQ